MRGLSRDKQTVYISQPLPPEEIVDSEGNPTGVQESVYDEYTALLLNVKPITDSLERQAFGSDVGSVLKVQCTPFDVDGYSFVEKSAVWIDVTPNGVLRDGNGARAMNNNYVVTQVIDTGGQTTVYLKKVAGESKA